MPALLPAPIPVRSCYRLPCQCRRCRHFRCPLLRVSTSTKFRSWLLLRTMSFDFVRCPCPTSSSNDAVSVRETDLSPLSWQHGNNIILSTRINSHQPRPRSEIQYRGFAQQPLWLQVFAQGPYPGLTALREPPLVSMDPEPKAQSLHVSTCPLCFSVILGVWRLKTYE